ncbi:MAG TPA: ABC transporter permease [Candidatus Acidoferrales bacterium]|jgi:putative ABC transport system permease protein|nr:ABC transporter permease [Candidatus Acidoferrales bacterium]
MKSLIRLVFRNPTYALSVIAVLAFGIGSSTVMFSVMYSVLFQPLGYPEPDRLYEVSGVTAEHGPTQVVPAVFQAIREQNRTLESAVLLRTRTFNTTGPQGSESVFGLALAGDGLRVFGSSPIVGRLFTPGAPDQVVISYSLWKRRYKGDPGVVGSVITLNGESYSIVGITPAGFETRNRIFELWVPWRFNTEELADHSAGGFDMLVRRRPAVVESAMVADLDRLGKLAGGRLSDDLRGWSPTVTRLKDAVVGQYRRILWVLLGAVCSVLAIACFNVGGLMIARGTERARDTALRIALGASRWEIVRYLLAESVLLAMSGAAVGLLLAWLGVRAIAAFPQTITVLPRLSQSSINGWVFCFNVTAGLVAGIAFGLVPAWRLSRVELADTLKRASRGLAGDRRILAIRRMAVIVQVALCVILVAGSGLLIRSFVNLLRTDPGFVAEGVITIWIPSVREQAGESLSAHYHAVLNEVREVPFVRAAALTTVLPLGPVEATTTVAPESDHIERNSAQPVQYRAVSPSYFSVMGISLLRGRDFNDGDTASAPGVAILNDVAARRYWPGEDPIGKRLATGFTDGRPEWTVVIGVVGGVRQSNLATEPREELYRPYTQDFFAEHGTMLAVKTQGDPRLAVPSLRAVLRAEAINHSVADMQLMTEKLAQSVARPRFYMILFSSFALIALVVATVGVYGVIAYGVQRRLREFGLRMALGAQRRDVLLMVLRQGVTDVLIGVLAGMAGALELTQLLASQLYGVRHNDPVALVMACVLLLIAGLGASIGPAFRATRLHPTEALRQD